MPKLFRVILSPRALADLVEVHAFIAQDSPDNAADMIKRILDAIDLLQTVPSRHVIEQKFSSTRPPVRSKTKATQPKLAKIQRRDREEASFVNAPLRVARFSHLGAIVDMSR